MGHKDITRIQFYNCLKYNTLNKFYSNEFNQELFKKIKKIFKGKTVTITISTELDETDYLNSNPANRKHLHESMAQEPTVSFTPEEFDRHVENLIKNS